MDIGKNIRTLRTKKGLTQKQLAEELNVTPQAVSRWEQGSVEPDIDTICKIAGIFGCTVVEIVHGKSEEVEKPKVEEVKQEPVAAPRSLAVIGTCVKCNKPIYEGQAIHRFYRGTTYVAECGACHKKEMQAQQEMAIIGREKRWKRAWGWSTFITLITLIITIIVALNQPDYLPAILGAGIPINVLFFMFLVCVFLNNTGVFEVFLEVWSWGFVKFPGVIFSLDFNGIMWLIGVKILFWILGFALATACCLLGLAIGLICSIVAFPLSIARWRRGYEYDNEFF